VRSTRSWPRTFFATSNPELAPLPLGQLEALADALLDFLSPADLASWLAANAAPVSEA